MTQVYSDPTRENDPYALPDIEVFALSELEASYNRHSIQETDCDSCLGLTEAGWYWWPCFLGCLPDGEPNGPFDSEEEAIANAQDIS